MQALLYGTCVYGYGKHIERSRSFRLEEGIVEGMRERSWIMRFSWYLLSCYGWKLECRSRRSADPRDARSPEMRTDGLDDLKL